MSEKKRILLIVNSGLLNSGVPKVVFDIITGLHSEFKFDILVQSPQKEYYDTFLQREGCKIFYTRRIPNGRLGIVYRMTVWAVQLFNIIRKNKYHCVHSFTAYQSGIDCWIAFICGVKVRISNTHGTVQQDKSLFFGTYQRICKSLVRKYATQRIGVSNQAAESIYEKGDFKIIYNSVPLEKLNKIKKTEHIGINFLQVGYFNDNKNQLFSLLLLKELVTRKNDCHIFFIGFDNGNGYGKKIDEFVLANKLSPYVTILPHDYPKDKVYPVIDFMLQPSYKEGLSLVALECQAAGIKCLVSNAIPEEVNIGLLHRLSLSDIKEWISCINQLKDRNEKVNLEYASRFSLDNFLRKILSIYNT